uniref:RNA-directed RNA polymerase n=1 Tax=Mahlapitsi orthoreovirus TaxID=2170064 RepID=A0A3G1DHM8_9REOV|nr:Lambda B [Mahlapitsi orthoreovirus]
MGSPIVPQVYHTFQEALSGLRDLQNDLFVHAAVELSKTDRSEVYKWLDNIQFTVHLSLPLTLFNKPSYGDYYYIDGSDRVRRRQLLDDDDVYVPNCRMNDVLEEVKDLPGYGRLKTVIDTAAKDGHRPSRMAATFYHTATSQARQIKGPIERYLQALLIAETCPLAADPCDLDQTDPPSLEENLPLLLIREIAKRIMDGEPSRTPWMFTAADVMWTLSPLMTSAIPPLMTDLANLAILKQMCRIPNVLIEQACLMFLNAADSGSYAWYVLKTKSIFPSNTLHNCYREPVEGYVPEIEWLLPRTDYRFSLRGARALTSDDRNNSESNEKKNVDLGKQFGCLDVVTKLRNLTRSIDKHDHDSVKFLRNAMACTSSIFIVRAPSETVMKEYTQSPVILKPIPPQDFEPPIGKVKYLKRDSTSIALHLSNAWEKAASAVANDNRNWDPLFQAIMRSQYVTSRGGSGAALRDTLKSVDVELPTFSGVKVKPSTKIMQAAQVANVPFYKLSRAVVSPLSMGLRNQVQRRPRTIMPMNVVQQQVSAIHTLVADYINKYMNLSTTSGSAVIEKVVPLGLCASAPPNQAINIDIKACDASITNQFFLSVIMGAIHRGVSQSNLQRPFMGVPTDRVRYIGSDGITSSIAISGMQNMAQHLAGLYDRGFTYNVNDHFSPGNVFVHHTTTFPSGSTATSTEHTANNSTMMDIFLRLWLPDNTKDVNLLKFAKSISIKSNYVCQGDDGIMMIDGNVTRMVSGETIRAFCDKLVEFGKEFGWNYDIEHNGSAEYLKLFFIFGCRVPNVSRHPIIGKERATAERAEVWPATLDVLMGIYWNGVHDMFHWRQWIRFCWVLAAQFSRQRSRHKQKTVSIQYPMWSFIYWGLPPIRVFGCPPYKISMYMPTGDMGMYALLTILRPYLLSYANARGYNCNKDGVLGPIDHERLFNDECLYQGYYMAQLPRSPIRTNRVGEKNETQAFLKALSEYLYIDPALKGRVMEGKMRWRRAGFTAISHPPSLDDVAERWYRGAQEADVATADEIAAMDDILLNAYTHKYQSFSKLLEAYLRVEWDAGEIIEPKIDLRVPLCAGVDPVNSDHFLKLYAIGPMMESTKRYFSQTLFMHRTVSGLDVEQIDRALLKLRALGAPREAVIAQLMMVGLEESDAATLASKIMVQDIHNVQLAKVVNLAIPDSWMTLDFDSLLKYNVKFNTRTVRSLTTDIPTDLSWLRPIFRFLGAAVIMTQAGVAPEVHLAHVRGGVRSLGVKFKRWMAAESKGR